MDVDWSKFPPILQDDGWVVVKVHGGYEAIEPLIPGLKADSFRYRDMSHAGGDRTWDRPFRMTDLTEGFLINSPWMEQARAAGATGVRVQFFDGLEKARAEAEIVGGNLIMTSTAGASTKFDISQLRLVFAADRTPLRNSSPPSLNSRGPHG